MCICANEQVCKGANEQVCKCANGLQACQFDLYMYKFL